jgi:hypothetical protein
MSLELSLKLYRKAKIFTFFYVCKVKLFSCIGTNIWQNEAGVGKIDWGLRDILGG